MKKTDKKQGLAMLPLKMKPPKINKEIVVAGHKLKPKEIAVFAYFHSVHSVNLTCKKFGFSPSTLFRMRKTAWWEEMSLDTTINWHNKFENKFMSSHEKLHQAYLEVLRGTHESPNAVAKFVELFLKASPKGIRATLVNRNEINITSKQQTDVNIRITSDGVRSLTNEQIGEWASGGPIPNEMTESVEDAEIIGDYTEVNDATE